MKKLSLSLVSVSLIFFLAAAASSETKIGNLKTQLKQDDIGVVADPAAQIPADDGTVAPESDAPTLDKPLRADSVVATGVRPVKGYRVTSEFGPRKLFGNYHYGIDIGCPTGTPARAIWDGTVAKTGYSIGGGNYIDIKYNNGLVSRYYHLKSISVKKGQKVKAGDKVAATDNTGTWTTGAHLHFQISKAGKKINPRTVLKI